MLKLFPSVCASQILWKFVPNCWSAQAETAAAKPSGLCTWDDNVTNSKVLLEQQRAAWLCRSPFL